MNLRLAKKLFGRKSFRAWTCATVIFLVVLLTGSAVYPASDNGPFEWETGAYAGIENYCVNILASNRITYESFESKGVDWTWYDDHTLSVYGTAYSKSLTNMYSDTERLPRGVRPGDDLYARLEIDGTGVSVEFLFYLESGSTSSAMISETGMIHVPSDAVGLSMRPTVLTGMTADAYIWKFELFRPARKAQEAPLIVSFIDDDTTKEDYVIKYHTACVKNGIQGNYAVITGHLVEGVTDPETLLAFQREGFGMLAHCDYQDGNNSPYWRGSGGYRTPQDLEACRQNILTCMDRLEAYGITGSTLWVTPFGVHDPEIQDLAREIGMDCLFSIGTEGVNTPCDEDKWNIKRFSLAADDSNEGKSLNSAKDQVDRCVRQGTGWLIITTHFNAWGKIPWDRTPDENGNETGYARFNEIVQYALDAGLVPMTVPEALRYYGPLLDTNSDTYANALVLKRTKKVRTGIGEYNEDAVY